MFDHQEKGDFKVQIENGGSFYVNAQKDAEGLIDKYRANIKAPVCEDRVCYDVNLVFYWNIIGDFISYETPQNEPLTKLDHVPFMPEDYQKLQKILVSQDLNFVKIPAKELVENPDQPKVDGYSGATKETVKKEVIGGALYTCYTLWHIANGAVADSIKKHSTNALNKALVSKIISQKNQKANYFLINNLPTHGFEENLKEILNIMTESKGYFSKNAFEKIPANLFNHNDLQGYILNNYLEFDYYTQKVIINKLEGKNLTAELKQFFLKEINPENTFQNQKLVALLLKNADKKTFKNVILQLEKNKTSVSEKNFEEIKKLNELYHLNISNLEKL
jgi:hypothetical protein